MAAEKFCPNNKPLANAITPRIPISVVAGLVKSLFLQLTISFLPLIWVAADFAETPSSLRGLGDAPGELQQIFNAGSYRLTLLSLVRARLQSCTLLVPLWMGFSPDGSWRVGDISAAKAG